MPRLLATFLKRLNWRTLGRVAATEKLDREFPSSTGCRYAGCSRRIRINYGREEFDDFRLTIAIATSITNAPLESNSTSHTEPPRVRVKV
jgi:hypothetical protein